MTSRSQYVESLYDEMRSSLARSEAAEETYRQRVEQHIAQGAKVGRSAVDCEVRASTDAIVVGARADGAYYRDRARTYGIAYLVEVAAAKEETWPTI